MKNVKTKNWGAQFKDVSNLMGLKARATAENESRLKAEVAAHDGSHSYGRHGAQTGWEAQFIRAVTHVTPDQTFDPMGLNPKLRRWNGVFATSDVNGSAVFDLFDTHGNPPTAYGTKPGDTAGGFITPEAQFLARARGEAVINSISGPGYYCAQYQFKTGPKKIRAPINAVHVVVGPTRKGGLYGLGFARREKNYPSHSRDFVVKCIEAFQSQKTWSQIYEKIDVSVFKFNKVALAKAKIAFPSVVELADYFDLDVLWQPNCSLIFRRTHDPLSQTHSAWRLVTMFPDDIDVGWAPDLFLSDPMKLALQAQGMNKNVNDYHWTGMVSNMAGTIKQTFPRPNW